MAPRPPSRGSMCNRRSASLLLRIELREVDAGTELHVRVTTDEQFEEMFETSWPKALELLKGICEQP